MKFMIARSVWGSNTSSRSAMSLVRFRKVVRFTIRVFACVSFRSEMRDHRIGWHSAMFAPQQTTASVSSMSS
jgi:hypothetical protein